MPMPTPLRRAALPLAFVLGVPAMAQDAPPPSTVLPAQAAPPYAEVADLVVASTFIVDATIRSADRIKAEEAPGLAPGSQRFFVTADVAALVRGSGAIPSRVGWLVDVAPDVDGRIPKLKKRRVLAFARAVAGQVDQLQLVRLDAQRMWTAPLDELSRRIAQEATAPDAPPAVTGVGNAFYSAGALPGEGETQIFLQTDGGRPAALTVSRHPDRAPRWSVATSEVIAADAPPPAPDTLLWYRLACALPATLPEASTDQLSAEDAAQVRQDYQVVIAGLGACRRGPTPFIA
jgi:hypothetical protein